MHSVLTDAFLLVYTLLARSFRPTQLLEVQDFVSATWRALIIFRFSAARRR